MCAVLGAKKVKGIAFCRKRSRPLADPQGVRYYISETIKRLRNHTVSQTHRSIGTPMMIAALNGVGASPM
jgi:aldehyde:ferredoxin oxidoreductase